jgi:endogenous inhibitor of DNA gyrase (YacG/DUF329 family)
MGWKGEGAGFMRLDLRPHCKRCGKIPRGKLQRENYDRYKPYCSYHCQEWHILEQAQRYIRDRYYVNSPECKLCRQEDTDDHP